MKDVIRVWCPGGTARLSITQELRLFLKPNDGFRKIVLVGDNVPAHVNEDGTMFKDVIDFMKDPKSLDRP